MSSRTRDAAGQSSVEAAVLLPTLMLLMGLLVQPVCVLYTRTVMRHAAAEAARLAGTCADDETVRAFVVRRLAAVPEVGPFHVGGTNGWDVGVERVDGGRSVRVRVSGRLRPLPILGLLACWLGEPDGDSVRVEVEVRELVRPSWWAGAGSG